MKSRQGFASMETLRVKEISAKGGRSAQANGKAHRWDSVEAKAAGVIGRREAKKNRAERKQVELTR